MSHAALRRFLFLALALAACGSPAAAPDAGVDGDLPDAVVRRDAGTDAGPPPPPTATGVFPAHDRTPFAWDRPDEGTPVPAADVTAATDQLLDLLARTDWLDLVADRAHGWPESDPEHRYWYATWWSGVGIQRRSGHLSYVHVDEGADNNGLRTPQILEGACYAWRLWHDDADRMLFRRLTRGLSSWHLAMRRSEADTERGLLSRAAYPPSIEDTDRDISIVYDAARPGTPGPPSYYVHLADNPSWGDVYVKNTRSKDDMGHLMRAMALVDTCAGSLEDADAEAEVVEMRRLYQEWAQRVESDGYRIATLDESGTPIIPEGDLATYVLRGGIECAAGYAIPLLGRQGTLGYTCANHGLGPVTDPFAGLNNSALQILRTHHEAAVGLALATGDAVLARDLAEGLALRMEGILDQYDAGTIPDNAHPTDVVQLVLESAMLGVPLTSREVRFLHSQLAMAASGYDTTGPEWHVRDAATPDGDYVFEPGGPGVDFKDLGLFLGLCTAQWVSPTTRQVLDCDRIRASARP